MNGMTAFILATQRAKRYTDSVALHGVPINYPRINSTTGHWELFDPTIPGYVDTGETGRARNLELTSDADFLKWRFVGDNNWIDLYDLSRLKAQDGKSAYELAVQAGFQGTLEQWLISLRGKDGEAPQFRIKENTDTIQYRFVNFEPTEWTDLYTFPGAGGGSGGGNAGGGGYEPPDGGIPREDLAQDVQDSLGKADSAVQPAALNTETQNRINADNALSGRVDEARAIAEGRARAKVFADVAELDAWLLVQENVDALNIGDLFLIIALDVPDYWWDGTQKQESESAKVDLTQYYTKTQIDNLLSSKLDITAFNTAMGLKVDITDFNSHANNTEKHITSQERSRWDGKLDAEEYVAPRGVATFTIGSDLLLTDTIGGEPLDPDDIEFDHIYYASGDWSTWIAESGVQHGDYLISPVNNKIFRVLQSAPSSPLVVVPQRLGPDFTSDIEAARDEAIQAAAENTDEKVAAAKLATQKWLPAVQTKSALPGALTSTSFTYLCRVLADPTPSNNGVWQAIPIDANNHAANWTWFGDNQDFIDELELEEALEAERTISDNSYLGKTAKAADSNKLDGKTASEYATATQGTKADNALPAASQAVDSAKLDGHLPDYFATAAALEATEFMKGDTGPQGPEGTRTGLIPRAIANWAIVQPEPSSFVLYLPEAASDKSYVISGSIVINGTSYNLSTVTTAGNDGAFRLLISGPNASISGAYLMVMVTADGIQMRYFANGGPVTVNSLNYNNLTIKEMVGIRGPKGEGVENQNISSQVSVVNNEILLGSNLNAGDLIVGWFRSNNQGRLYTIVPFTLPAKSGTSWDVKVMDNTTTVILSVIWMNNAYRLTLPPSATGISDVFIWVAKGSPGEKGDPGFGVPPLPNESGNFTLKVTRTNNGTQGQPVWVKEV